MNKDKTLEEVCNLLNLLSNEHEIEIGNGASINAAYLRQAFNNVVVRSRYSLSEIYYTMNNSEETTNHTKELFDIFVSEKNPKSVVAFKNMHSNLKNKNSNFEKQG